jgi:hypothetical protein
MTAFAKNSQQHWNSVSYVDIRKWILGAADASFLLANLRLLSH